MNATAKLIRCYDHVTLLLCDLYSLKSSDRVDFQMAITVYECLRGLAPQYLAGSIQRITDTGINPYVRQRKF
jgi:hypothetical protein